VREYELYIPLKYNDGSPIEDAKIQAIGERLLEQFGGVTFFPQRNQGMWRMGAVTFRDEIVIFRVLTERARRARHFFRHLKEDLKRDLQQEEILIVEKKAEVL
jgi:hypothetical protein